MLNLAKFNEITDDINISFIDYESNIIAAPSFCIINVNDTNRFAINTEHKLITKDSINNLIKQAIECINSNKVLRVSEISNAYYKYI